MGGFAADADLLSMLLFKDLAADRVGGGGVIQMDRRSSAPLWSRLTSQSGAAGSTIDGQWLEPPPPRSAAWRSVMLQPAPATRKGTARGSGCDMLSWMKKFLSACLGTSATPLDDAPQNIGHTTKFLSSAANPPPELTATQRAELGTAHRAARPYSKLPSCAMCRAGRCQGCRQRGVGGAAQPSIVWPSPTRVEQEASRASVSARLAFFSLLCFTKCLS